MAARCAQFPGFIARYLAGNFILFFVSPATIATLRVNG